MVRLYRDRRYAESTASRNCGWKNRQRKERRVALFSSSLRNPALSLAAEIKVRFSPVQISLLNCHFYKRSHIQKDAEHQPVIRISYTLHYIVYLGAFVM